MLIASGISDDMQVIFTIASVLGAVACLSSLLLLWACLDSHHPYSLFRRMHLPPIPYGKIITLIYLKVAPSHAQAFLSPDSFYTLLYNYVERMLLLRTAYYALQRQLCVCAKLYSEKVACSAVCVGAVSHKQVLRRCRSPTS